jgi:hypothetical protein
MSQEELDLWQDYYLNIPEPKDISDSQSKFTVHKNFRLWLIAEMDKVDQIPGKTRMFSKLDLQKFNIRDLFKLEPLIYDAVKITPRLPDLKQTYLSCMTRGDQEEIAQSTAILHTYLSHNDYIREQPWYFLKYSSFLFPVFASNRNELFFQGMYKISVKA